MTEGSAKAVIVPDQGDPDRKRALNVLAQRRYRQRRREKIQSLESSVQSTAAATSMASIVMPPPPEFDEQSVSTWEDMPIHYQTQSLDSYTACPADFQVLGGDAFIAVNGFQDNPINHTAPFFSPTSNYNHNSIPNPPSTLDNTPTNSRATTNPLSLTSEPPNLAASQFTFLDDKQLAVPFQARAFAGIAIASMLGCPTDLWDATTLRTFQRSQIPTQIIPENFIPTQAQQHIPHQVALDCLVWPSVRTKLICVLAQPAHSRPLGSREPDAFMKLAWDVTDEDEGIRLSGGDYFDEKNWEVGQKIFENWWWAFDRGIVENSNALRKKRGAPPLVVPAGAG